MLKQIEEQLRLWDCILPEPLTILPDQLAKVDMLLEDERFMQPFIKNHYTKTGRPTYPIERYCQLMYLKHLYGFGYESLEKEVGDSFTWRRFCRIGIDEEMPDSTTLIKATKRYGEIVIEQLNQGLILKLAEQKVLKHRKLRTDTTVVESDIHHPTDAILLQDGIKVITRMVRKLHVVASQATIQFTDRTTEVIEKILSIVKLLGRRIGQSFQEIDAITKEVVAISEDVCAQANKVLNMTRDKGKSSVKSMKNKLEQTIDLTSRLALQARQVVSGNRIISHRIVSFFIHRLDQLKRESLVKDGVWLQSTY